MDRLIECPTAKRKRYFVKGVRKRQPASSVICPICGEKLDSASGKRIEYTDAKGNKQTTIEVDEHLLFED